jgi:hypothetical protein
MPYFADNQHLKRTSQKLRHFGSHHHTTARQP